MSKVEGTLVKPEQLKKIFEGIVLMVISTLAVISAVASYASTTEENFTSIFTYSLLSSIGLTVVLLFLNKNRLKELLDLRKTVLKTILWIKRIFRII
ncbi:MAG: hypothetical protein QXL27_06775 [Candidatus Bathyarchaeia archaeon]